MEKTDKDHPRTVIPELCRKFYELGWMTGSGGALGVRQGDKIYITPSGVQKELVQGDDVFVQSSDGTDISQTPPDSRWGLCMMGWITNTDKIISILGDDLFVQSTDGSDISQPPPEKKLKKNAGAVFHLHTKSAVMASIVSPGIEFKVTHLKMIQGIKKGNSSQHFDYYDTMVVPIIENKSTEDEIADALTNAMNDYPETSAVLIRRHGIYVWGPTWQKTKLQAECFEYLFDIALQMKLHGVNPDTVPIPPEGAYL